MTVIDMADFRAKKSATLADFGCSAPDWFKQRFAGECDYCGFGPYHPWHGQTEPIAAMSEPAL